MKLAELKALVLGYDTFMVRSVVVNNNPSSLVAEMLNEVRIGRCRVVGYSIPVSYRFVVEKLPEILDKGEWCCAIGVGLSPLIAKPVVELAAANVAYDSDFYGYLPKDGVLISEDEYAHVEPIPLDVKSLRDCLKHRGFEDVAYKLTIGSYLCNALAYILYRWGRRRGKPAVFIHVPPCGAIADTIVGGERSGREYALLHLRELILAIISCLCRCKNHS
jgi:pyroglutamyl-peptidase